MKEIPNLSSKLLSRFWSKIDVQDSDDCWVWQDWLDTDGYGHFRIGPKSYSSHRISYSIAHPKEKLGSQICHACNNPACNNPKHLYNGTAATNGRDIANAGIKKGIKHPSNKYTEKQILQVIALKDLTDIEISKRLKIPRATVNAVLYGYEWSHLTGIKPGDRHKGQKGTQNPQAKLTETSIKSIRRLAGSVSNRQLAREFGVSSTCINAIVSHKTWSHI
jgi:DNA-binding CsgD family transcriptional regulator